MVKTLFCAGKELDDDIIISYSDIIYSSGVLESLLASPSDLSVVVDKDWKELWELRMDEPLADAETMKLDNQGNIIELGKKPKSYDEIEGQYIGLIKISRKVISKVCQYYASLDRRAVYDGNSFDNMYMTSFIQLIIDNLMPVKAVIINGGWLEIDTVSDLERYQKNEL
jgi:choline kinase